MTDPDKPLHGDGADRNLSNADIAPVPPGRRNWSAISFFALWVGMVVNIPAYMIAASLVDGGMSWSQAMWTVLLGNVIVLIPMVLSGHAGTKYGIPFPVFARAAFGIRGAHIPSFLRAIVACGWFGIQTWIGGAAIYTLVLIVWPGAENLPQVLPDFIGINLVQFACFMAFWFMNIWLIWKGINSIKVLEHLAAPFLLACGLGLLWWAWVSADGFGPMLEAESKFATRAEFWKLFFPSLTAMVGFWATLCLNISDFTRYAKSQSAQVIGQAAGLPTTMVLFAFIGVAVTSATIVVYGEAIWDPVILVRRFDTPLIVFASMVAVIIATLSTNAAANVVSPANNFSNMWPSKIDFKRGGYITGVIGIVMMPWKLLADPSGYIFTWLIGYSALLGPVIGIILVDYYLVRKTELDIRELYRFDGRYKGINNKAIIAMLLGIAPNIPGFLAQIGVIGTGGALVELYHYAWFIGLAISSLAYYVLMGGKEQTA
ncbi:MAG: nitrate reductase [Xanthomonadales bacterium]|nr:nitrate reductase [Xanthomonadales bacterium]NIN59688.1 nitrate reductase [Xanthomonadales bacterium]NIN75101.1 nitrate reductase [Xanthomonadales bacterium]NIO15075.1 nitrate reductase [Xanthomonadales bacterium]NIP12081.1 nitrate reductase [Xanthomonadales bacterium]